MPANLRDRLKRIQEQKKTASPQNDLSPITDPGTLVPALINQGWQTCGFKVLKRVVSADTLLKPESLPPALAIIVPDMAGISGIHKQRVFSPEDFLFFDLETTGLSGGAGTVAFLAAFGRLTSAGKLCITQYLLLDYPGENDFLEAVLSEFKEQTIIVSYNGKSFDSQILKTRCLMNRIKQPEYHHVDLLHPARRLWKNVIYDCSQTSIETRILGLDRSDDIPGALAPEIWFEFLKTGRTDRLMGISDHNTSDIKGLAAILSVMIFIATDPFNPEYRYDIERLALYWRDYNRRKTGENKDLQITGEKLLLKSAQQNHPKAAFVYALDQIRSGNQKEGRKNMLNIITSDFPETTKASALRALAIDSEGRLKDIPEALEFAKQGQKLKNIGEFRQYEFKCRIERLEKKSSC